MECHRILSGGFLLLMLGLATVSGAFAAGDKIPLTHPPQANEDLRACTICHEPDETFPFERFDHNLFFGRNHAGAARGNQAVCRMCHPSSYCSTCHGVGIGLKPSLKLHGDPRPRMPHRGDYLTRHRIDGRLNPTSCFRCHGSPKTTKRCRPCHP